MPYIKVDTRRLSNFGNVASSTRSRVGNIKSSFSSIGSSLDWDVKACSGINRTISQINNELSGEMSSLRRIETFFDLAVRKYNDAEKSKEKLSKIPQTRRVSTLGPGGRISNITKNVALLSVFKNNKVSVAKQIKIPEDFGEKVGDLFFGIAKKFGVVGSVISIVEDEYSFFNKIKKGDYIGAVSSFGQVAKGTYKTVSKVIKKGINMAKVSPMLHWTTQAKSWGKTLLGFDNYFNPKTVGVASKASKTTTRIYNNMQKTFDFEFGKITKADVVISCIFNAFDNYSEAKSGEISGGRAVIETVTETAIDVVVDAALWAGTAAILAGVAGTAAVPAIAIAAVTVAAKWLLDITANAITGRDDGFTEIVSDGLIKIGQGIGNAAKKVANTVAPVIRNTCSTVISKTGEFFGNVKNGVNNFFGKLKFAF